MSLKKRFFVTIKDMKLYLVRHGESISNVGNLIQPPEVELSEKGKEQSKLLAKRFKDIPIDVIISSSLERAKQTTAIINKVVKKEVIYTDLLVERISPSKFIGMPDITPEFDELNRVLRDSTDPSYHHSDEENFFDLKDRAESFLEFVSNRKEENILCITHGMFLKILISSMMLREDLTPKIAFNSYDFFRAQNTGITLCLKDNKRGWSMHVWNDHAHLGEL